MRVFKNVLTTLILLFCGYASFAQKVSFVTHAPSLVAAGEVFRVEFTLENTRPDGFNAPVFDGFDIIAGPSVSEGSSTYIINGNIEQSSSYSYTYVLIAKSEGKFTIPAVSITSEGKTYTAKAIPIEVVKEAGGAGNSAGGTANTQKPAASVADDDILIRAIVSRNQVYRGQPVKVTFKLYTRVPISGASSSKSPAFNGFWTQKLDTENYTQQRETYNSKIYETNVVGEYLLYPQQAGTLQIDPYEITVVAQVVTQSRRQSLFDDFFGGGPNIQEVRKKISSPTLKITVNELPSGAPEGFNGAVGNFTMTSEAPQGSIAANSASTYTIKISGTGNLPLIQSPKPEMPNSFEQYNIKTTESLNHGGSGITGYRQFEYPFIARAEGDYTIAPVSFSFFNPETSKYVTLSTRESNLYVVADSLGNRNASGGIISGITKEDIRILDRDIHFIKLGNPGFVRNGSMFAGSPAYMVTLFSLLAVSIILFLYLQKRMNEMRSINAVRGKRANKVALSRLRTAEEHMGQNNERRFYDEMLKALWGYLSDKLNIPSANLTKENVREELGRRSIPADVINRYVDLISDCEYAQYSPAEDSGMSDIYRSAAGLISNLESHIKK